MPSSVPPDLRPKVKKPTVTIVRKPPAPTATTKGAVKPTTGMAGLYGGLGPTAYVNNLYAPQQQLLTQQQTARTEGLNKLVGEFLASLKGVSAELAPYQAAASQQNSDAANAAASLVASNPNAVTQADLAAINAPQAQRDAVTGTNNTAFGGNAALLKYAGGAIPADVFRQDAAGRAAFLAALPAIGGALGVQGTNRLGYLSSQENLRFAADKAQALAQARAQLSDFVTKNQSNKISQAAVVGNLLGYIPAGLLGNKEPITSLSGQKFAFDKNQATARAKAPNASLSRVYGYVVDSKGNAILANGQQQPLPTKPNTPKANASLSKALGYVVDNSGNAILQKGKRITLPKAGTKPKTLSRTTISKQTSLALAGARKFHSGWTDDNGYNDPGSWQEYLDWGLGKGIDVNILIKTGKRLYSRAEIRQGLIPKGKSGG